MNQYSHLSNEELILRLKFRTDLTELEQELLTRLDDLDYEYDLLYHEKERRVNNRPY